MFNQHKFECEYSGPKPNITISYEAAVMMSKIIALSPLEVSWLGTVDKSGLDFTIKEIFLVKQEVTGASTEMDEDDIVRLYEWISENRPEDINKVLLWGHSHVTMGVGPSSQDDLEFEKLRADNPFFIRAIGNKYGALKFTIALGDIQFDDVPWEIDFPMEDDTAIKAELDRLVSERKYEPVLSRWQQGGSASDGFGWGGVY